MSSLINIHAAKCACTHMHAHTRAPHKGNIRIRRKPHVHVGKMQVLAQGLHLLLYNLGSFSPLTEPPVSLLTEEGGDALPQRIAEGFKGCKVWGGFWNLGSKAPWMVVVCPAWSILSTVSIKSSNNYLNSKIRNVACLWKPLKIFEAINDFKELQCPQITVFWEAGRDLIL